MDNANTDESLRDILGLQDEMHTYFLRAPSEYWQVLGKRLQPYDDNVGEYEFIHAFFTKIDEMSNFADILESKLSPDGIMWISWPKLSALEDIGPELTEQDIRDVFLPLGLVDTKACAITNEWSGLKFVHRKS